MIVSEATTWQRCLFRSDGALENPNIHDNFVYALAVHLEQRVLVLHTEYRDRPAPFEFTDVRFLGVVVHHFDDVAAPSILLDIMAVSPDWILKQGGELFLSR